MTKICTTIEQSQKLIKLGIDINTADMYWWNNTEEKRYEASLIDYGFISDMDIPAWSLSALMKLMPKVESMDYNAYPILEHDDGGFAISSPIYNTGYYEEPIDAAFEIIIWLKENNKI